MKKILGGLYRYHLPLQNLDYQEINILLKEEDFNLINAKALVVKKIQEEIVRLAEHKEWQVTI